MSDRRTALQTADAPAPRSAFSQGVDAGPVVFVSGQLGLDPQTGAIPGDVRMETRFVLDYIRAILASADLGLEDVAKTTVYVTNFDDYTAINEVYGEYFTQPYPARATVRVAGLLAGARVEIEAVAVRRNP